MGLGWVQSRSVEKMRGGGSCRELYCNALRPRFETAPDLAGTTEPRLFLALAES